MTDLRLYPLAGEEGQPAITLLERAGGYDALEVALPAASTTLHLAVAIPTCIVAALPQRAGVLLPFAEVAGAAATAERLALAALRERLADADLAIDAAHPCLGIHGIAGAVRHRVRAHLAIPALGPQPDPTAAPVSLRVDLAAEVTLTADVPALGLTGTAAAVVSASARLSADPRVDLAVDVPSHPGLTFRLPALPFPDLSLDGLAGELPLPPLRIPLPDLPGFGLVLDHPPLLRLTLQNGALTLRSSLPQETRLLLLRPGGNPILLANIERCDLVIADQQTLTVVVRPHTVRETIPLDRAIEIADPQRLPFALRILVASATLEVTPAGDRIGAVADLVLARVAVSPYAEPAKVLAFSGTLRLTLANGTVGTDLVDVAVLEPTHHALTNWAADALDGLTRLIVDLEAVAAAAAVVERLRDLAIAAATWTARLAGEAGSLLSGVAETAAALLGDVLTRLVAVGQAGASTVTLELRFDSVDWQLRQVLLSPAAPAQAVTAAALGLTLTLPAGLQPTLIWDLREGWAGLLVRPVPPDPLTLGTDLWLGADGVPSGAIRPIETPSEPLVTLELRLLRELVLVAVGRGGAHFLSTFAVDVAPLPVPAAFPVIGVIGPLRPAALATHVSVSVRLDRAGRALSLIPKVDAAGALLQCVTVTRRLLPAPPPAPPDDKANHIRIPLVVTVHVADGFAPAADLDVWLDPHTFAASLAADAFTADVEATYDFDPNTDYDSSFGRRPDQQRLDLFGLAVLIGHRYFPGRGAAGGPRTYKRFTLRFADNDLSLTLHQDALIEVFYSRISPDRRGLVFHVDTFTIGRQGLDLVAKVTDDPVVLAGIEEPFRFDSGTLAIRGGQLEAASLAGHGQLPRALVGEATAKIALTLGVAGGRLALESATARLDNGGAPLFSKGTRLRVTVDELGLGFKATPNGYLLYFLLTGALEFRPDADEFASGLLKKLSSAKVKLDRVPLAGNASELLKYISFQVEVDPPVTASLFDIFRFEIRGIGFHPRHAGWADNPPAASISGQIAFLDTGDIVSAEFDFHALWIAPPAGDSGLPRIQCDGLTVGLSVGAIGRVKGTAIAVDRNLPSLRLGSLVGGDRAITAEGFLARGELETKALGSFSAALGIMELRRDGGDPGHAFFLGAKRNKLSERIDTPVGTFYIRDASVGLGYGFQPVALGAADSAESPAKAVRRLDDAVSRASNLDQFDGWTANSGRFTLSLALGAVITYASASTSESYNERVEADLPNPVLIDALVALRSDLTFIMTARVYIAYNYHDWLTSPAGGWKNNPPLKGYIYFSVPRREFLGRMVARGDGAIGRHPEIPAPLVQALRSAEWSATLYIRPGLFHYEFGWPYELKFAFGQPNEAFYLSCQGGMVFRVEDATMLYGIAMRASGHIRLEGRVGGEGLGASASAVATFAVDAKLIAYVAPLDPRDTFFYGSLHLEILIEFAVSIWLSFSVLGKRIRLSVSFSLSLAVSIAAEVVASLAGIGADVRASIGVRGFGRTLSISVGLRFNADQLERARSRVDRFLGLGLGIETPRPETFAPTPAPDAPRPEKRRPETFAPTPAPEPSRGHRVLAEEERHTAAPRPTVPPAGEELLDCACPAGRPIGRTNFWAMLTAVAGQPDTYLMQLVPCDLGAPDGNDAPATFYAAPRRKRVAEETSPPAPDFDHALELDHRAWPAGFSHLGADGRPVPLTTPLHPTVITYDEVIGTGTTADGVPQEPLRVLDLFADMFLGSSDDGTLYTEPLPLHAGADEPLPTDPDAAADAIARAGDTRYAGPASNGPANAKQRWSLAVADRRSALVQLIGDSVTRMAAAGVDSDGRYLGDASVPPALSARHVGLTFVVTGAALEELLLPTSAKGAEDAPQARSVAEPKGQLLRFQLRKRVGSDDCAGTVRLFRHPDESFAAHQPYLVRAGGERVGTGFRLTWDLEPAWGGSQHDVLGDPESALAHYRVERVIEGLASNYGHRFNVKRADILAYEYCDDAIIATRRTAPLAIVDDLSEAGMPPDLRAVLLGLPVPSGRPVDAVLREALVAAAWPDNDVVMSYTVTPYDTMGTSADPIPFEVKVSRPEVVVPAPLAVGVEVAYAAMPMQPPTAGGAVTAILVSLAVAADGRTEHLGRTFVLRIRRDAIRGGGQLGGEAVSEAKAQPGPREMDEFRAGRDTDLRLELVADGAGEVAVSLVVAGGTPQRLGGRVTTPDGRPVVLGPALGVPLPNTPLPGQPQARRMFVRELPTGTQGIALRVASAWTLAALALVLHAPRAAAATRIPLELLEHPFHTSFEALHADHVEAVAGDVEGVFPCHDADLAGLGRRPLPLTTLPDIDNRVAVALSFAARAAVLDRPAAGLDLAPLVGGYDLFAIDPDAASAALGADAARIAAMARPLGSVRVLPRSLAGSVAPDIADFKTLTAHYPSEALRREDPGTRRGSWYSTAESLAAFPLPRVRRSLASAPDDSLVAALAASARTTRIIVHAQRRVGVETAPVSLTVDALGDIGWNSPAPGTFALASGEAASPAALRRLLQVLVWFDAADTNVDHDYREWLRTGSPDERRSEFEIEVTFTACADAAPYLVHEETRRLDLHGALHPVLADALDFACYDVAGQDVPYRRYEVVADPVAPTDAATLDALLDTRPAANDPHGWGALRLMRLAVGLRLFDIDTGELLTGRRFVDVLSQAMTRAVERYAQIPEGTPSDANATFDLRRLGQPFLELVAAEEVALQLSSFDGRSHDPAELSRRVEVASSLCVAQLSLRPVPLQWTVAEVDNPVRYLVLVRKEAAGEFRDIPLGSVARELDVLAVDVVDVAGGGGWRPVRIALGVAGPVIDGAAIRAARPGDIVAAIRVAASRPDQAFWDAVFRTIPEDPWIDSHFVDAPPAEPIPAPENGPPASVDLFERFPPLDGTTLGALLSDASRASDLVVHLPRPVVVDAAKALSTPPSPERSALAQRIAAWTERFLRHGAALRPDPVDPRLPFALAAPRGLDGTSRAVDADGRVRLMLIEKARAGVRRLYAVRPYGRYADLEALATGVSRRRELPVPDGANLLWLYQHCAVAVLPRTEEIHKPVILHAGGPAENEPGGFVDLVVARPQDLTTAHANIPADRALAPRHVGVELVRVFPHLDRAAALVGIDRAQAMVRAPFGSGVADVPAEPLDAAALTRLAGSVPDLWRGAIHYRFDALPYFFDVVALTHVSAGVVVSPPTATRLPDRRTRPGLPPLDGLPPPNRGPATQPPRYEVTLDQQDAVGLRFDLPLMRNLDGVTDADTLATWSAGADPLAQALFSLPDGEASYRISLDALDGTATGPELEILPRPLRLGDEGAPDPLSLYRPLASGSRFADVAVVRLEDQAGGIIGPTNWRLVLAATLRVPPAAEAPGLTDAASAAAQLAGFVLPADRAAEADAFARHAPRREAVGTVVATPPLDTLRIQLDAALAVLRPHAGALDNDAAIGWLGEAVAATRDEAAWRNFAETRGATVTVRLVPGMGTIGGAPDGPFVTELRAWAWPETPPPAHADRALGFAALLAGAPADSPAHLYAPRFLADLRRRWLAAEAAETPFAGLTPAEAPLPRGAPVPVAPLPPPFVVVVRQAFAFTDAEAGPRAAALAALFAAAEASARTDPAGANLAVLSLAEAEAIPLSGLGALESVTVAASPSLIGRMKALPGIVARGDAALAARIARPPTRVDWHALATALRGVPGAADLAAAFSRAAAAQLFGGNEPVLRVFRSDNPPRREVIKPLLPEFA